MLVVEIDIWLHALGYPGSNEPLDGGLLLGSDSLLFGIVSLPLQGEEICETAQPLPFPLDLTLPFTKSAQPINISCNPCISNGFYGPGHNIVHLEALP